MSHFLRHVACCLLRLFCFFLLRILLRFLLFIYRRFDKFANKTCNKTTTKTTAYEQQNDKHEKQSSVRHLP